MCLAQASRKLDFDSFCETRHFLVFDQSLAVRKVEGLQPIPYSIEASALAWPHRFGDEPASAKLALPRFLGNVVTLGNVIILGSVVFRTSEEQLHCDYDAGVGRVDFGRLLSLTRLVNIRRIVFLIWNGVLIS